MQALPFIAAAGALAQGVGGFMAGNADKRAADAQAHEEELAAAAQGRAVREEARSRIGELLASSESNGLEGGSGTALDALRESQVNAALDAMEVRRQGDLKARSLRAQGKARQTEGRFALLSGVLGAGSQYLGMKHDWAQARAGDGGYGTGHRPPVPGAPG